MNILEHLGSSRNTGAKNESADFYVRNAKEQNNQQEVPNTLWCLVTICGTLYWSDWLWVIDLPSKASHLTGHWSAWLEHWQYRTTLTPWGTGRKGCLNTTYHQVCIPCHLLVKMHRLSFQHKLDIPEINQLKFKTNWILVKLLLKKKMMNERITYKKKMTLILVKV